VESRSGEWGREEIVYEHDTFVRDIAFVAEANDVALFFSEASGAGANGKIYKLVQGDPVLYYEVVLEEVGGFWAGDFAFDDQQTLYLSSGNRVPASIYKVTADGRVTEIFRDAEGPIAGLTYVPGALYYANWRTQIYHLDLSTGERTVVYGNAQQTQLSDVGVIGQEPATPTATPTVTDTLTSTPTNTPTATATPTAVPNGELVVITLDNVGVGQCDETWDEAGVVLSFVNTIDEDCGQGSCFFGTSEGGVSLAPARLSLDLSGLADRVIAAEVDVIDGCGTSCTQAFLYSGDTQVDHASNVESEETFQLSSQGADVDRLAVSSCEGTVDEIRLWLRMDTPTPTATPTSTSTGTPSLTATHTATPTITLAPTGTRTPTVTPAAGPAILEANYHVGAPGSFFTLTARNFPPNDIATIEINGVRLGEIPTDRVGSFVFLLGTEGADPGRYVVAATVNPEAIIILSLDPDTPTHPPERDGPVFEVPAGIALTELVYLSIISRFR
jgi:hypothetical protein